MRSNPLVIVSVILVAACSKKVEPPPTGAPAATVSSSPAPSPDAEAPPATTPAADAGGPAPVADAAAPVADAAAPAPDAEPTPLAEADVAAAPAPVAPRRLPADAKVVTGFAAPESVLVVGDLAPEYLLVSNVNGDPSAKDDNGFISKVALDGTVTALRFIDGAAGDVELHAPKGMAERDGLLYVADIDHVRRFDLATGQPKGAVAIPGAVFLNDMMTCQTSKVCVTDSALDAAFKPAGTPAVYSLEGDTIATVVSGPALGHPNGIADGLDGWVVVGFDATKQLHNFGWDNAAGPGIALTFGQLDGVAAFVGRFGGSYVVSSWERGSVFEVHVDDAGKVVERALVEGVKGPADFVLFGADPLTAKVRIALPLMLEDTLVIAGLDLTNVGPPADWDPLMKALVTPLADIVDATRGVYVDFGKTRRWLTREELGLPNNELARLTIARAADFITGEDRGDPCDEAALKCADGGHDIYVDLRFAKDAAGAPRLVGLLLKEGMFEDSEIEAFTKPFDKALAKQGLGPK